MVGNSAFLSSRHRYLGKLLEFRKACLGPFRVPRETWAFSGNAAALRGLLKCTGENFVVAWVCGGKLRVPLEFRVDLGDHSCLLREVRSPLALRGAPRDSSCLAAGMKRASTRGEAGISGFLSISDFDRRVSAEL